MTKPKLVTNLNERRDTALAATMALRDSLAAGTHMLTAVFDEDTDALTHEFRAALVSLPGWLAPVLRANDRPGIAAARSRIIKQIRRPPSWQK